MSSPAARAIDAAHKVYQLSLGTPNEAIALELLRRTVNQVRRAQEARELDQFIARHERTTP